MEMSRWMSGDVRLAHTATPVYHPYFYWASYVVNYFPSLVFQIYDPPMTFTL